jgi:hypothetical protein
MPKISRVIGTTSQMVDVFVQNNSVTTGAGLTGLVFNTSGLTAYYHRNTASSSVAITLATATLGTFTSSGFIVVDGTNMPGTYQIGIPNAALASGADSVVIYLTGAANMAPCVLEIELTATNNQNGNNFGLAYLPQAPMMVKKNQALAAFAFPMFNASGSPTTGLTVTAQRTIDGGAFGSCTNAVTETANGWYQINLSAADLNGTVIGLRFSASGAQDNDVTIITQA